MLKLEKLASDFELLRDPDIGRKRIKNRLKIIEKNINHEYLAPWYSLSKEDDHVYPSQGLLRTPFDYLNYEGISMLPSEKIIKTLRLRWYFLEMFNHPYRMHFLKQTSDAKFNPVPKVKSEVFKNAFKTGLSISIGDLGASVVGSDKDRVSRTQRYAQGPFIKLGRQARIPFVGSASPDVWNSTAAVTTMAASHALAAIPRNGVLSDIKQQADLAREVFDWLDQLEEKLLDKRTDRKFVSNQWRNNVMGTLETRGDKALIRANELYKAGVRTFRVYSPEPGLGPVETVKVLRSEYGQKIEIITGMIVDVDQAIAAQKAGADALTIGIGGGGRCITGVRSGSVIDWPTLLWKLRGEITIPIIVEGGASDHVAVTLLLGASGIGVTRIVGGGTIESPGGALFCSDGKGRLFKPYGGEASARTKYLDGKVLPFDIPSFVEGETTKAYMSYVKHAMPTLTYNLHLLLEDSILAMVFRNVNSISQLHGLAPSPLRQGTGSDIFQRNTH
ncbi:MAG: Inosine-5'-monophosphate dehydrogenase [Candidatus Woesebacteria bacterium GW2011_GWB1_38_5b]|uniref:Inosine-5'-monophosphate dehydrogenase n=1 Tax=Candidatus Woesebacteria bacterium GW2011_GWB1_38_5b TaxID=1618569 RepID=A0A0G0MQL5_9BACT|nr:MAG: Inosine-5'-monophosphate dehydrogenase [Candidatus Woesebacteria bacterium GW2011_GWB1_38_5b]